MYIWEKENVGGGRNSHSVSSRYFSFKSHLVTYCTSWKRVSCSLCIIRTMTFELESRGVNTPLQSQVAGVRGVLIIALPADEPAEMGKEQRVTAFILCCQAVGLWEGAVVATGNEHSHCLLSSFHILEEKDYLALLRIKRQPTSQCPVLHCRRRRKYFWKGNSWSQRSPVDTPSVDAMFSLRIGDVTYV